VVVEEQGLMTMGADGAGFLAGLSHPLGGPDHLLAMVAIGVWAAQCGGRALGALPAAFLGGMVAGGLLGLTGFGLPGVEELILASVMGLGLLVLLKARPPVAAGAALAFLLALFHGHAHGAEMPEAASPLLYAAGFLLAAAGLHGAGLAATRLLSSPLVRLSGGAVTAAGLLLTVS
jgi:urease accessory protein